VPHPLVSLVSLAQPAIQNEDKIARSCSLARVPLIEIVGAANSRRLLSKQAPMNGRQQQAVLLLPGSLCTAVHAGRSTEELSAVPKLADLRVGCINVFVLAPLLPIMAVGVPLFICLDCMPADRPALLALSMRRQFLYVVANCMCAPTYIYMSPS